MKSLRLSRIVKTFGTTEVLKGIDLEVATGEFVVFVGPSGCGKSTLLRIIAGLEDHTSGSVEIAGKAVDAVPPAERGIAMVFQSYALYPHLTVAGNMDLALKQAGIGKAEREAAVAKAAGLLDLSALLKRRPSELSGGQRQRVAIGRAIVRDPKLFLFDEPLSNLDAALRVNTRLEIARLHRALGATMIYVTHDQIEAMTLADRIVVMREGGVEQAGTPEDLYQNPSNLFVAGFIGSPRMNFLRAAVKPPGRIALEAGATLAVPAPGAGDGQAILVGVRPEHFIAPDGADVALDLKVDVVENLGGTHYLYGTLPSGEALVVEGRDLPKPKAGDAIRVGFSAAQALRFLPSGERLRDAP